MRALLVYHLAAWQPKDGKSNGKVFWGIAAQDPRFNSRFVSGYPETLGVGSSGMPELNLVGSACSHIYLRGSSANRDWWLGVHELAPTRIMPIITSIHSRLVSWSQTVRMSPKRSLTMRDILRRDVWRAFFALPSFKQPDDERMLTPHWDDISHLTNVSLQGNVNMTFWV